MQNRENTFHEAADGIHFRCDSCGGALLYDIQKNRHVLRCSSCDKTKAVRSIPDPTLDSPEAADGQMETLEYRCPSCGAVLHSTQTSVTSYCNYCGSDVVLTERVSHMMRPSKIVPFTVTREQCEQIYRKRLSESRFTPAEMASQETISHFRPVYVPFWRYSGSGEGESQGKNLVSYSKDGYHYYDTYEVELKNRISISGVYYDASSMFDDETAQELCFSEKGMVPFHPAYLAGFYAEAPDLEPEACYRWLSAYSQGCFNEYLRKSKVCKAASFPDKFKEEAELVLMPVWLLASRRGEQVVYTAINGTKENIRCDLPVSPRRAALTTAVITAILAALMLVLHHFILLKPRITAAIGCLLAMVCWDLTGPFLNRLTRKRNADDDLTRIMKKKKGASKEPDEVNPDAQAKQDALKPPVSPKGLIWCAGIAFGLFLFGLLLSSNRVLYLDNLLSDRSWLPYCLTIAAGIMDFCILLSLHDISMPCRFTLWAQLLLCVLLLFSPTNVNYAWFYGLILINYALTLGVVISGMAMHNQYVSRPVPFFGKEGKEE